MSASAALVASATDQAFITSLVANVALLVIQVGAFSVLKRRMSRIYSPRTFLPPPDKRANDLPKGIWRWLPAIIKAPTDNIIHINGLDAYLFLRYLKMLVIIFFVHTIATFTVILPINAVNVTNGRVGINKFNWENLTLSSQQDRYAAHIIIVYFLTTFVVLMIRREMMHFVFMQQRFLISKDHSQLAQARTVLITSVPDDLANEEDMRLFTSFVPGGIDRVWFIRDTKELNKLFEKRQQACTKLEAAESAVLRRATRALGAMETQRKKVQKKKSKDEEKQPASEGLPQHRPSMEFLRDLVPPGRRPKHRVGFMGLFGDKVDTIDYCKEEISRLNPLIAEAQKHIVKGKFLGSVFIRCNLQMGAHVLAQCISHHKPFTMYDKWLEVHPKDIVWENLADSTVATRTRTIVSWLLTLGLIVIWVFPVGFVGTLSNISSLCTKVSSLSWVCSAHKPIPGIIQGVLPPIILAAFFALVPLIFRALAWYECIPRNSLISVSVYRRFFLFLLIHGFLIVTVSSGITAAIADIARNPASAVKTLASRLSGASTFFLTYMVTQGLAGAGLALTQLVPILFYYFRKVFLGRTPRQAFEVTFIMPCADFGIILPMFSLLATIAFAYSVISPLINALALLSFICIYVAWKYLILQVLDQPNEMETSGRYFIMAMSRLFVGLYVEQFCLACLFFLKISISRIPSIIDAATMITLSALTIYAHVMIHDSFRPITNYLPMTLATRKLAKRYEREKKRGAEDHRYRGGDILNFNRIMSVRKRLAPRKDYVDNPHPRPSSELHELDVKDPDKDTEHVALAASGSSGHQRKTPELFRHLSVPEEDKHDLYNRQKPSPSSKPASIAERAKDDLDISLPKHQEKSEVPTNEGVKVKIDDDTNPDEGDDDEPASHDEGDFDEHAFDHPSTYKGQPCIWIPRDTLGLSRVLVKDLTEAGIIASDAGAVMDEKGIVEVLRSPPDEEWKDGIDR